MTDSFLSVAVDIGCDSWIDGAPGVPRMVEEAAAFAARRAIMIPPEGSGHRIVIGITLTDDDEQRGLNRDYRGKDISTNVLAFPADRPDSRLPEGAPLLLGDIVLAFETVRREADEQQKAFADHLRHLVVHGVLHLLGHDHEAEAEAVRMEALEIDILAELGVADPYADTMFVAESEALR